MPLQDFQPQIGSFLLVLMFPLVISIVIFERIEGKNISGFLTENILDV